METKVFAHNGSGVKVIGDSRCIATPFKCKSEVAEILEWCQETGIDATNGIEEAHSNLAGYICNISLWKIVDEKQRLLFALRWA